MNGRKMSMSKQDTSRRNERKENLYMDLDFDVEDDEGYQKLRMQSIEAKNTEEMSVSRNINEPKTSRRSWKTVLMVLLIIVLICGLATTSALFALERSNTNNKQPVLQLAKDQFINIPCRNRKSKTTNPENTELGSRGRSFLVSFIQNHNKANETNRTVIVSSETDFNVTVSLSESQISNMISISSRRSGNVTLKKLNVHYSLVPTYFSTESKAIIINTSVTTSVLSYSTHHLSSDTTTVFPTDKLSTFYVISTATTPAPYLGSGSHFTVASMADNTLVTIVFATDYDTKIKLGGKHYEKGEAFNIVLNMYQTFQIGHNADLTGTTIHSSNPIAVFVGNRCTSVLYHHESCSMLMEMVPPVDKLDSVFIVPPNIHRYQSHVRILSAVKTDIKYTTKEIKTTTLLLKNRFVEFPVRENEIGIIRSTEAVLVNSIALSSTKTKIYGDPFMITIPGINQYLNAYTNFVPEGFNFSFATFIIKNDSLRNLQINGTTIKEHNCLFHSSVLVGTALYDVCTVGVPSGVIEVHTSDGSRFGFIVTGQRNYDGHGYTGNALLTTSCGT